MSILLRFKAILYVLCPTFCRLYYKIQPGKYLPGLISNKSLQNVGHNISPRTYYSHLRLYFSQFLAQTVHSLA